MKFSFIEDITPVSAVIPSSRDLPFGGGGLRENMHDKLSHYLSENYLVRGETMSSTQ